MARNADDEKRLVATLAEEMGSRLMENRDKGGWRKEEQAWYVAQAMKHVGRAVVEMEALNKAEAIKRIADAANLLMMAADVVGEK